MKVKYDLVARWSVLAVMAVLLFLVLSNSAHAFCQMTTVIDPGTGLVKLCTQCCEAGTCTVVCN